MTGGDLAAGLEREGYAGEGGWGRVVERWRCGGRVVCLECPSVGVSWVVGVGVVCVAVGVWGLVQPLNRGLAGGEVERLVPVPEMMELVDWGGAEAVGGEGDVAAVAETVAAADELVSEREVAVMEEEIFDVPAAVPMEPWVPVELTPPARPARSVASANPRRDRTTPPAGGGGGRQADAGRGSGGGGSGGSGDAGSAGGGRASGYFPTPPYPSQARARGQQGSVQLQVVFGADGRVTEATVSRSSGYSELDRAAAQWVRRHWRAASGQVGRFRLPVHFKLR